MKLCHFSKKTVIIFLVVLLVALSRYPMLNSTVNKVWWNYDDSEYISVANNIRRGDGFNIDILEYNQVLTKTQSGEVIYRYIEYKNVGRPYYFAGPIYPLYLATVFIIFSAKPPTWYMIASLANLVITTFVIVAIYFFAQKLFDHNTAILASITAALLPSLYWYSIRPLPYPLLFLFIVLAFLVASSTLGDKRWLLIGALGALAHLTHGSGILVIATFFLWCLVDMRFKDSMILMISYIVVMLPWMIRNQLFLGDFGLGLSIPTRAILSIFSSFSSFSILVNNVTHNFSVLQILLKIPKELSELYSMWYVVIILLFFSFIGVWKYRNKKILVPQLIFLLLSLLGYIYLAFATNKATIETKYLMASFIVLLPLSMHGFIKLMSVYFFKLLLCILIISLVSFNINLNKNYNWPMAETSEQMQFHEWLRNLYLPSETVVLTNAPHVLYLRTGLKSLYLDFNANSTQIEWLIDRYNVDYLAIYLFLPTAFSNLVFMSRHNITEIYSTSSIRFYKINKCPLGYQLTVPELHNVDIYHYPFRQAKLAKT